MENTSKSFYFTCLLGLENSCVQELTSKITHSPLQISSIKIQQGKVFFQTNSDLQIQEQA